MPKLKLGSKISKIPLKFQLFDLEIFNVEFSKTERIVEKFNWSDFWKIAYKNKALRIVRASKN